MRKSIFFTGFIICLFSFAAAQTPGFYLIFGSRDGSTVDVYLDDLIELRAWLATPSYFDIDSNGIQDTINFAHIPLATHDSVIPSRDGGILYSPFIYWDDVSFTDISHPQPGYTNQSLLGFEVCVGWFCRPLNTYEDTLNVFSFYMRTANDSSLIGQTVCPLIEGFDSANGGILYGMQDGVTPIIPSQTFSCLYFVEYLAGDANGSGSVDGLDVIYLVNYFKGFGPPPDPFLGGDANGDCIVNGMDVIYLVAYLKGGPAPFLGSCH
jgi:hypothetical protein